MVYVDGVENVDAELLTPLKKASGSVGCPVGVLSPPAVSVVPDWICPL